MSKIYIYMDHFGAEFYLSDRERTAAELYCKVCECSDDFIGVYEDEKSLAAKVTELFKEGYDLLPCDNYDEIKEKYCPPKLREWGKSFEETREDIEETTKWTFTNS